MTKFRVNRRKVGLTYSCPTGADDNPIESKEDLLKFLEDLGGHCQYVIAKELHESGKKHYHAYCNFDAKIDTKNERFFDYEGVHPNIIKPGAGWIGYCKKDKEFITNIEVNPFTTAINMETVEQACDFLWKSRPQCMALHGKQVESNLRKKMRIEPPSEGPFFGPYWFEPLTDIKTTVLVGASGIGKTEFAITHFGGREFFVSHIDQLKNYDPTKYSGIIFDDMDFKHMPRETQIAITDWNQPRSIHGRYQPAYIPRHTPKIFTANFDPFDFSDPAIARRCDVHYLKIPEVTEPEWGWDPTIKAFRLNNVFKL